MKGLLIMAAVAFALYFIFESRQAATGGVEGFQVSGLIGPKTLDIGLAFGPRGGTTGKGCGCK